VIRPFGEAALLVEAGSAERAQALATAARSLPGVAAAVPGLASVLVELDPLGPEPAALTPTIADRLAAVGDEPTAGGRLHVIPVVYDGPDLADVARLTGTTAADVAELHAGAELRVLFCGFAPGFAYLGGLPPALRVERLVTPRTRTPAGSVAIAGSMSGIYPADLPGGWRVIGRTGVTLFDPRRDAPALLLPGDRVRFERVG
jgi:KipI family sensor histidine kinase inhibitor